MQGKLIGLDGVGLALAEAREKFAQRTFKDASRVHGRRPISEPYFAPCVRAGNDANKNVTNPPRRRQLF
jgi:hypothetical protein